LSIPFVLFVAMAAVFGPVCSWLALRRARSWATWFIFGVLIGPLAVVLLVAAPPGRCPSCGTATRGWPSRCAGCGLEFAGAAPGGAEAGGSPALAPSTATTGPAQRELAPRSTSRRSASNGTVTEATAGTTNGTADSPETRPATRLGRRATAVARAASDRTGGASQTVAILGSGVFVGGSDELQIGSRYLFARVGNELQALGPIHMSPSAVATKLKLTDVETTVVSDRLLITGRGRASGRTLAFAGVTMEPGMDIEREIRGRRRPKVAAP
jgi:hypothetical protein